MSLEAQRAGPRTDSLEVAKPATGHTSTDPSLVPVDPLDAIAEQRCGSFVLVVKATGGRYRRRCFLSVAAAEKAARNATDAGHIAYVYLCELKPLWRLVGGDG